MPKRNDDQGTSTTSFAYAGRLGGDGSRASTPDPGRSQEIDGPFTVGDLGVRPFVQDHGFGPSLGFRFGDIAYSTDVASLDDKAFEALKGVRYWIVDATRRLPHPSHSHLEQTLHWIERVRPERAWLTHMNQSMDYDTLSAELPAHVRPAHDGLVIEV